MSEIPKKIVRDEQDRPVSVEIDYADWVRVEPYLPEDFLPATTNLNRHADTMTLSEEPLEYQARIRNEWD